MRRAAPRSVNPQSGTIHFDHFDPLGFPFIHNPISTAISIPIYFDSLGLGIPSRRDSQLSGLARMDSSALINFDSLGSTPTEPPSPCVFAPLSEPHPRRISATRLDLV
jgi:hypothetical protein